MSTKTQTSNNRRAEIDGHLWLRKTVCKIKNRTTGRVVESFLFMVLVQCESNSDG